MKTENNKNRKTRIIKGRACQGTDCYIFEIVNAKKFPYSSPTYLSNKQGTRYGRVYSQRGKNFVELTLPHIVRCNNVQPFTLADNINAVRNEVYEDLISIFGTDFHSKVYCIECNITKGVSGNATASDVLNLLSHSLLSDKADNIKYVGPNRQCKLKEDNHTIICKKAHYYIIKAYNKTEQMKKKKCRNADTQILPNDVLRIEVILKGRTLEKLFGKKTDILDILTYESLLAIVREYKRIFSTVIVNSKIKPYLTGCKRALLKSMRETNSVEITIARMQECIPDSKVLYKAIKQLQDERMLSNHALRDTKRYIKKYNLPQDTILTLHDFKKSCG